jgi:hypothetical protein
MNRREGKRSRPQCIQCVSFLDASLGNAAKYRIRRGVSELLRGCVLPDVVALFPNSRPLK